MRERTEMVGGNLDLISTPVTARRSRHECRWNAEEPSARLPLTCLRVRQCNGPIHDPEQVLRGHVAHCGDLAARTDLGVHAVTVLHLDLERNICQWFRTELIVVVVNEQVRPEVGSAPAR